MTSDFDAFKAEQAVLSEGEALLASGGAGQIDTDDYQSLLKAYRKLLKTSQRLMKLSDFNESGLREANERIQNQQRQLEQTLKDLQETQEQLVQAEKMAALAGLVAGIAHEINTPVGIALTASTTLEDETAKLRTAVAEGQAKKSQVAAYLEIASEGARLITGHCRRAGELIQSFKKMAVDQSSDQRRTLALDAYLDDIAVSLGPELKKTRVTLSVACPAGLLVETFPGALSQIVTNLVMNALIHGFDEGRIAGSIRIDVAVDPAGLITLRHADTGKGVPEAVAGRIFEPFFTTRRGLGGSGLGLGIVYNLVTRSLGGTVQLEQTPGGGATFVIVFPATSQAAESA